MRSYACPKMQKWLFRHHVDGTCILQNPAFGNSEISSCIRLMHIVQLLQYPFLEIDAHPFDY